MSELAAYDELTKDAARHHGAWQRYVDFYGVAYPLIRVTLSVATAIVAATERAEWLSSRAPG